MVEQFVTAISVNKGKSVSWKKKKKQKQKIGVIFMCIKLLGSQDEEIFNACGVF